MQEIDFPIEFLVDGTPVSANSGNGVRRAEWKDHVQESCRKVLPDQHVCAEGRFSVTILHFPDAPMEGDVDNIVKLILDAMRKFVFFDDNQVEQVFVRKIEPGRDVEFRNPSDLLIGALEMDKPITFVRVNSDLTEYRL